MRAGTKSWKFGTEVGTCVEVRAIGVDGGENAFNSFDSLKCVAGEPPEGVCATQNESVVKAPTGTGRGL